MAIDDLANLIASGMAGPTDHDGLAEKTRQAIAGLFGTRYRADSKYAMRVALMAGADAVSFAGLVHEESPSSGVYGGMSLIWFPIEKQSDSPPSSLLTFVCGTRGLSPDEQILGRPGHARHLTALKRHLGDAFGVQMWVKHDPTNLTEPFPRIMRDRFSRYRRVFERYGDYIYAAVEVPSELPVSRAVVGSFLDLYAWERGWTPLSRTLAEIEQLKLALRAHLFPRLTDGALHELLRTRRFVILQGPPGTGKTRLATLLLDQYFRGNGMSVQFHPAVTYETFVAGISPDVAHETLRFNVKRGWLAEAVQEAKMGDYLFVVDEINRADLGRVLGEAIFLFEPREIAQGKGRRIRLPHGIASGDDTLEIPPGLFVLGTMNSADRSIAILDLAVRRRFAFVDLWPSIEVVDQQGLELATNAFGRLLDIFAQYAPDDALALVPGHAYFLADSDRELAHRLRYELVPLILEYLQEGRLATCESELRAYLDWLDSEIAQHAATT